jgi:hypothetical protein
MCQQLGSELDAAAQVQQQSLGDAAQQGLAALDDQLNQAVSGLGEAATAAVTQATEMATQLGQGLAEGATAFGTGLDTMLTDVDTQLGTLVTDSVAAAASTVDSTQTQLTEQQAAIGTELDQVATSVGDALTEAMGPINADITTEAENAASKIQPWWKKALAAVVSIVVAIVVVIAVTAFCVVTLGTGAIVAGIVAGAVAGLASTFASDATMSLLTWSNQFSSWKTYLAAGLTGAALGGLGGWMGPMLSGASTSVKVAAGAGVSFTGATLDQVMDVVILGEGWNWGEWFTAGTAGAILGAMATKFVPSDLGTRIRSNLFSGAPGTNSWNNFQSTFSQIPGLSGSTAAQRSAIYALVADKTRDIPSDLATQALQILEVTDDPDQRPVDPKDYQGKGSRVQFGTDVPIPAF